MSKRELVTLLLLYFRCLVTVNVLWLFLTVSWVHLQYVIVVFTEHTLLLLLKNDTHIHIECKQTQTLTLESARAEVCSHLPLD